MTMNSEDKKLWVDALRSGDYKKGRNNLKQRNTNGEITYCCLGVLCQVKGLKEVAYSIGTENKFHFQYKGYISSKYLPAGLKTEINFPVDQEGVLAKMNDFDRRSFSEIADYIEKYL